ncbi:hypothetical protein [Bacillus sp. MRMR6]|uniref:hypothetical protein n=1 Tax=Bacillus sp. MRMR6 TaxID=1928617 RepID=UPI00111533CB|nr:hypothetical protein [Bacillus sp. MRMR6]
MFRPDTAPIHQLDSFAKRLDWGYYYTLRERADNIHISIYYRGREDYRYPVWEGIVPKRQGEVVYDTYHTKIVFGVTGDKQLYVRGERKTHPRERFGPRYIRTLKPPLECIGNVCCTPDGICFEMAGGAASSSPRMLQLPFMPTPTVPTTAILNSVFLSPIRCSHPHLNCAHSRDYGWSCFYT